MTFRGDKNKKRQIMCFSFINLVNNCMAQNIPDKYQVNNIK